MMLGNTIYLNGICGRLVYSVLCLAHHASVLRVCDDIRHDAYQGNQDNEELTPSNTYNPPPKEASAEFVGETRQMMDRHGMVCSMAAF